MTRIHINADDMRRAIKPLSQITGKDNLLVPIARLVVDIESFTIEISDGEFSAALRYDAATVEGFFIDHTGPVRETLVSRAQLLAFIKRTKKNDTVFITYEEDYGLWLFEWEGDDEYATSLSPLSMAFVDLPQTENWDEGIELDGPEFWRMLWLAHIAAAHADMDNMPVGSVAIDLMVGEMYSTDVVDMVFGGIFTTDSLFGHRVLVPRKSVKMLRQALQEPERLVCVLDTASGNLCFQTEDGQFFVHTVDAEYPTQVRKYLLDGPASDIMLRGTVVDWKLLMTELKSVNMEEATLRYADGTCTAVADSSTFQVPQFEGAKLSDKILALETLDTPYHHSITFNPTHVLQILTALKSVKQEWIGVAWNMDWRFLNSPLAILCVGDDDDRITNKGIGYLVIPIHKEQTADAF